MTQFTAIRDAVGGVMSPNKGRELRPQAGQGGESPYLQQQNFSLAALAKRDAQADPFAPNTPPPMQQDQPQEPQADQPPPAEKDIDVTALFTQDLREVAYATR